MGCFLDCFVKKKERRRRKKSTKRVQPNDQRNGCDVALHHTNDSNQDQRVASSEPSEPSEPTICLNKDSTQKPIAPVAEASGKLEEPLGVGVRKKVTFDLNVQAYENNSTQEDEKDESEEEKRREKRQLNSLSEDGTSVASMGSFPSNHRYQNCSISDDEYEAESECTDLDDDSDDYFDDDDEYDYETGREEFSKSISQCGPETRVDEKEVIGPLCHGSQYNRSVLSPIENLSQWKAVKMSSKPPLKQQKEKTDLGEDIQIPFSPNTSFTFSPVSSASKMDRFGSPNTAVDTSFSNWLDTSEATPSSKTGNFSFGIESAESSKSPRSNSPQSYEDRPILGALTVEELRQFSVTSSPRKSPSRSPDEMPIFGNVGSYWSHTEQASNSSSSSPCNGIGNATSRYREVFVK